MEYFAFSSVPFRPVNDGAGPVHPHQHTQGHERRDQQNKSDQSADQIEQALARLVTQILSIAVLQDRDKADVVFGKFRRDKIKTLRDDPDGDAPIPGVAQELQKNLTVMMDCDKYLIDEFLPDNFFKIGELAKNFYMHPRIGLLKIIQISCHLDP